MTSAQSQSPTQVTEQLQGVVERLTYHASESGYCVARLKVPRIRDLVTIVGNFANIQPGQTLHLTGIWREHPKYGQQFQVQRYRETKPATITGIQKYLGSGLIKGVGPVTAKRIVEHFGLDTLEIIENEIERLIEVPGIAKKRVNKIQAAWQAQKAIKEVMVFLQGHGVSTTFAVKIFKQYGEQAIDVVTHNPYQLAADIYGIGFITADLIARHLGIAANSEYRYRSGLLHVFAVASKDGHCFLPHNELIGWGIKCLTLPDHMPKMEQLEAVVHQMVLEQHIIQEAHSEHERGQRRCYASAFHHCEQSLAQRLQQLLRQPLLVDIPRVQRWLDRFSAHTGVQLAPHQRLAVEQAAQHRVLVLTGGPGTGKTFTTRTIVALWRAMGKEIALASPTGRAAQRLSEMTGQAATTIHRLLDFDPKSMKFKRDEQHPIPADVIVIDEASMVDLFLAHSLIKAVGTHAQLLLVGDTDQLPSVGPGQVLQDLIDSGRIPVIRLSEVFRQAQASKIVANAHRINQGQYPHLESIQGTPQTDCLWLGAPEPEDGVQGIRDVITELIPKFGFQAAQDVQLLCPMSRGTVGTRNLNQVLQALINPPSPNKAELVRGGMTLRVGDRVLQQVNDYNREVSNGDQGVIETIDLEEQEITVDFAGRHVSYDSADINEITLAWAMTIHKSQGSEYPVVILPIYMQHYIMLSRNLLYTGLTRAKQLAILVGPKRAIGYAVGQIKDQQRYTLLDQRLAATGQDTDFLEWFETTDPHLNRSYNSTAIRNEG